MKLRILSVSHKVPNFIAQGCDEFLGRFNKKDIELIEIKAVRKNKNLSTQSLLAHEALKIKQFIDTKDYNICMQVTGKSLTSIELANKIRSLNIYPRVNFIIGSADGLDDSIYALSNFNLSLSSLVMPHSIARLVLIEALYRGCSIINNHPYHRE